jgi:Domain of unknown function (DUF5597)/Glycosyl hydrolases family 35
MRHFCQTLLAAIATALLPCSAYSADPPRVVEKGGRHALLVDGAPFLVLGAQINNSSSWPASMPEVWPALQAMHANTVEAPVYWEQLEPHPGAFDFSTVDMLVRQSREQHLHLVLLWFGTWKNGNMHYVPQWVKTDTKTYPRVINSFGEPIDVLSANSRSNLEADKRAFAAMMHRLAEIDAAEHTVIFVQVENESGIVGSVRDFSSEANRQFAEQVPEDLLKVVKKPRGTWREVFGGNADEIFQAYYQAHYVNEIADAGKREFNIPLYCNVWLSYPVAELPERQAPNPGIGYPSGGPVQEMLPVWKALVPAVDVIGPDIYSDDRGFYKKVLETYTGHNNALWIPETGRGDSFAPFLFMALGNGAIGFSPFGIDRTGWSYTGEEGPQAHTENFKLLGSMGREIATWNYEGKLKTAVESAGNAEQELDFGTWKAAVRFGFPQSDGRHAPGTKDLMGRALIAQLAPDEFLVTGFDVSVAFHQPGRLPGIRMQILSAEEGSYKDGTWKPLRLWNGDQTDRGLNFKQHTETAVRIRLSTF